MVGWWWVCGVGSREQGELAVLEEVLGGGVVMRLMVWLRLYGLTGGSCACRGIDVD